MDKRFDKLTDSRWFMKLVALVLALLLFGSVYEGSNTNNVNVPGEEGTVTISDIPVKSYYDTENLIVIGVPETVNVTLKGPTPNLQAVKTQKDFEVYADLSKVKVGKQRIKLQVKDLSDKLTATIDPEYVEVDIQEKVTKEYSVDVEFDVKMVDEGYIASTPVVAPNKVRITGGKDIMDQIRYVRAIVEVDDFITGTVEKSAIITVLDANLNKLNVTVEQKSVRVTIPIKKANKTVPIEIVRKGTAPADVTIDSITLDKNEATISGSEDNLNKTENVKVEVDISTIKESTELTLPVIISDGINEVDPKTVKATVKVSAISAATGPTENKATKIFSNLPINVTGLSEKLNAVLQDPTSGETNLTVEGTNEDLENLEASDFQLSVDVADLNAGEHNVKLNVVGPENVSWTPDIETVSVVLTAKEPT
jgi:YbbR domain-containing protein